MKTNPLANQNNSLNELAKQASTFIVPIIGVLNTNVSGLGFDYILDERVDSRTDISKYATENSKTLSDNSVHQPRTMYLSGYFGDDVVFKENPSPAQNLAKLGKNVVMLTELLPKLTEAQSEAFNFSHNFRNQNIQENLNEVIDLWTSIKDILPPKLPSEKAYVYLEALRLSEQPVVVVLNQGNSSQFKNFYITNVVRNNVSDQWGVLKIDIELQEVFFAETQVTVFSKENFAQPVREKLSPPEIISKNKVKDYNTTFAKKQYLEYRKKR